MVHLPVSLARAVTSEQADRWAAVRRLACTLSPIASWCGELANGLARATERPTIVFTLPPGSPPQAPQDFDAPGIAKVAEHLATQYHPRITREGGWKRQLDHHHGTTFATDPLSAGDGVTRDLHEACLRPHGFAGLIEAFALDTAGQPVMWIVILCAEPPREVLAGVARPLQDLCDLIGDHVTSVLEMARAFGNGLPPAAWRNLSARQRQIALMVTQGLSNLTVAARIGISEATVAVHLRDIYRKLEVHNRTQLANAVHGNRVGA
jgi:DNA-binding CsgD family transcriptional regulator